MKHGEDGGNKSTDPIEPEAHKPLAGGAAQRNHRKKIYRKTYAPAGAQEERVLWFCGSRLTLLPERLDLPLPIRCCRQSQGFSAASGGSGVCI
jgi:hypothetical protein